MNSWKLALTLLLALLASPAVLSTASPQNPTPPAVAVTGHLFKPGKTPATDERIRGLKVPQGFSVSVFAKDLGNPRMLAVSTDGTVYATRQQSNDVIALSEDGNHTAPKLRVVVAGLEQVHGIAIHEGKVYLASPTTVWLSSIEADGGLSAPMPIIHDLPDGGQHRGRTIDIGPDRMLYVSVGSSCNDCAEAGKDRATMLRFDLNGGGRTVFAQGLRNTIGFAWHPTTRTLWGMDNGSDWKGDDLPPEELNAIRENGDYGWPLCYGKRVVDRITVSEPVQVLGREMTKEQYCATTEPATLEYPAHSAPIGMVFYNANQFPPDFKGDALVAFHGSWNRQTPAGYKVVRVRFRNNQPQGFEDFLTGFLVDAGTRQFGRPAGIAVARDGALLVSDDANGLIYRIAYAGAGAAR